MSVLTCSTVCFPFCLQCRDSTAAIQYVVSAIVNISCKKGRDERQKAVMQGSAWSCEPDVFCTYIHTQNKREGRKYVWCSMPFLVQYLSIGGTDQITRHEACCKNHMTLMHVTLLLYVASYHDG